MNEMQELWEKELAEAGFNIWAAIAGFIGSLFAIFFHPHPRSRWHSAGNVIAGAVAAGYSAELVSEVAGLPVSMSSGIGFGIGLFGMAIADKLIDFIADSKFQDIIDVFNPLKRLFNKFNKKK